MDCIVYGVTKSQTLLSDFHFHSIKETVVGSKTGKVGKGQIMEGPMYHAMEVDVYPEPIPSSLLPHHAMEQACDRNASHPPQAPKWPMLMVTENKMYNKATAFPVLEIPEVWEIVSCFFPQTKP